MRDLPGSGELVIRAACFGAEVAVHVSGQHSYRLAYEAVQELHEIDRRLSRFRPDSELCRLNGDSRVAVPASPLMLDLAEAVMRAGDRSGGLVDGTLLGPLERAGYVSSMESGSPPETSAGEVTPVTPPRPALPGRGWRMVTVDRARSQICRPTGVRIDSGGLGKGLAADRVGEPLKAAASFCVDCAGDLLIGGAAAIPRMIDVEHPLTGEIAHSMPVTHGGVATSGILRRAWRAEDGTPRHHLIDPGRGEPAFTGVIQATALAPTALEAEVLAKAALLAGPSHASRWLPHGGVVVTDGGTVVPVEPVERFTEAEAA